MMIMIIVAICIIFNITEWDGSAIVLLRHENLQMQDNKNINKVDK